MIFNICSLGNFGQWKGGERGEFQGKIGGRGGSIYFSPHIEHGKAESKDT